MSQTLFYKLEQHWKLRKISVTATLGGHQDEYDQLTEEITQYVHHCTLNRQEIKVLSQTLANQTLSPADIYTVRLREAGLMRKLLLTEADIIELQDKRHKLDIKIVALRQALQGFIIKEKKMAIATERGRRSVL